MSASYMNRGDGMKKLCIFTVLICMFISCISVSATSGVGGYNRYRNKRYADKEFEELRERIQKDGYFKIDWKDNPLKDTNFEYNYLITEYQSEWYEVWIDDDDYNDYVKAERSGDKATSLAVLELNCVIIGWYEYREVDSENPTGRTGNDIPADWGRGTIQFTVSGDNLKGDVFLTLYESERNEYYSIVIYEVNNYKTVEVLPTGHYYFSNAYINETLKPVYDNDLSEYGFTVLENDSKIIPFGFDTTDIPNVSWKDKTDTVTYVNTDTMDTDKTVTPSITALPEQSEIPGIISADIEVQEETGTFPLWIVWVVLSSVAVFIVAIVVIVIRRNMSDEF